MARPHRRLVQHFVDARRLCRRIRTPRRIGADLSGRRTREDGLMVGGPVFGPQPRLKQALVVVAFVVAFVALAVGLSALIGCSTHSYLYRPVPAEMIPAEPALPAVSADELRCLSDDAYLRLAERDRARKQYADELRALLGERD